MYIGGRYLEYFQALEYSDDKIMITPPVSIRPLFSLFYIIMKKDIMIKDGFSPVTKYPSLLYAIRIYLKRNDTINKRFKFNRS